ncbi:MAG TPA: response regulator [Candidatus Atribacteria bacterium]|nr:response regulator [Candidatus Atribacteria bacterium]
MLSILIADDEKMVRRGIISLIKRFGYELEILEASNGEEARRTLKSQPVDILMTDVEMPFVNGLELGSFARSLYPDIKIIVFSAYSKFEYARNAITLDAVHYLLKPIDIDEFKEVMDKVMELCRHDKQTAYQPLFEEQDTIFRDSFMNADITEEILYQIPFFNKAASDQKYYLSMLSLSKPFFYANAAALKGLLAEARALDSHLFIIDETRGLFAFRVRYPNELDLLAWNHRAIDRIGSLRKDLTAFAVYSPGVSGMHSIKKELEKIIELQDLKFYVNTNAVFSTDFADARNTTVIDTEPLISSIGNDIQSEDFESMKSDIAVLLGIIASNKQLSSLYVKYIFIDIIKKISDKLGGKVKNEARECINALSGISSIKEVYDCLLPIFQKLDQLRNNTDNDKRIVNQIMQCIQQEYMKDLTLEYLSGKVYLSPAYTSTLFKKETGLTITNYINSVRMEKAKELLKNTNMKIVDICPAVGYSSQTYFCILFRSMFGMTPTEYREANR